MDVSRSRQHENGGKIHQGAARSVAPAATTHSMARELQQPNLLISQQNDRDIAGDRAQILYTLLRTFEKR